MWLNHLTLQWASWVAASPKKSGLWVRLKVMCEVDDDESFIPFGFANRMVPRLVPY